MGIIQTKVVKMKKANMVFFDVDTQNDFMCREFVNEKGLTEKGALYISNAEEIIPNLELLTKYAQDNSIRILGSVDRHFKSDPELILNGGAFPEHCMDGTYGQKKITATTPPNFKFIENMEYGDDELEDIVKSGCGLYFEKQSFNTFDNPNAKKVLEILKPNVVVVYGVATDFCLKYAALGLSAALKKNGTKIYLVEDAIKAVNINHDDGKKAIEEMLKEGNRLIKIEDVLEEKIWEKAL